MPFKIYRSSAGSGKTFTLVKEYLRIALATDREDAYRGILAITFTNKAAEEMKARVIETLAELAENPEEKHAMTDILVSEIGATTNILASRAQRVLKHMLHHYSDISISTIDHFTHKVIRTFAQDLGLSINFEVELDGERLKQEIVDQLLMRVGSDKILTKALIDVVQGQIEEEKSWSLDDKLKQFVDVLFSEESRFHLEKLKNISLSDFNALRGKLRSKLLDTKTELKTIGTTFSRTLKEKGLEVQHLAGGTRGLSNFFIKLAKNKFEMPTPTVVKQIDKDSLHSSKATSSEQAIIENWRPEIIKSYGRSMELLQFLDYYKTIFNHIYGIALLEEMQGIQSEIQAEQELLHIGEFNHVVSNVVMNESAPFIYERIGAKFNHFLVDEFQDTSVLQWFNLLPLIDESLAHDNLCLVVGDAKQSIYRWRGGDSQQFVELPSIHKTEYLQERLEDQPELGQLIRERENTLQNRAKVEMLDTNYRSFSSIIAFNNELFESLQNEMPSQFQKMYDGGSQKTFKEKQGLVGIQFFRQEDKGRAWSEYDSLTLDQIKTWIDDCIQDGYAPGDIAIIFRTNKHAIGAAQFLIENGHKVVSNESLLINSSPKVRLLVNLVIFLSNPDNSTNIAELIQHLGIVRNEEMLTSTRLMVVNNLKSKNEILSLLAELYPSIKWNRLKREPLFSLFENLIHGLFPNDSEAQLRFFMDEVLNFNQTHGNDLRAFVDHWREKRGKASIALTENREAIRILTIHKSKGLEFPVVIHPYADYSNTSSKNYVWVYTNDEELKPLDRLRIKATETLANTPFAPYLETENALIAMDMYNLLYVSMTRPRERLYVCGKLKKENATDQTPSTAIQFIYNHLTLLEGTTISEELSFSIGNRDTVEQTEETSNYLQLHHTGDPDWMQRISISRPSTRQWVTTTDATDARQYGILVHEALALVKTKNDIGQAIQVLVEDGRIGKNEVAELEARLIDLIESPDLKPLFAADKQIKNEADIQLMSGKWLRPDRVVLKNEKAWVIDYKTGEENKNHHKQVTEYKDALYQLGFKQVEGMLVYVDTQLVVPV